MLFAGQSSARVDILCRYVKFFHGLRRSASQEVQFLCRYLARDVLSVTGKNLRYIEEESGLNCLTASRGKLRAALEVSEAVEVPEQDRWRLSYLSSLLSQRREAYNKALEDKVDVLTELINSLVIN